MNALWAFRVNYIGILQTQSNAMASNIPEIFGRKTSCTVKDVRSATASDPAPFVEAPIDFELPPQAPSRPRSSGTRLCCAAFVLGLVLSGAAAGLVYMLIV